MVDSLHVKMSKVLGYDTRTSKMGTAKRITRNGAKIIQ